MMPPMATGGGTRLLIATGEAAASAGGLPHLIRALIENASGSARDPDARQQAAVARRSDSDRARYEADERLSTVLGQVETIAPKAAIEGRIGDDTPFTAFADAIRDFLPDHILLALRRGDHSGWQERGLLDQIRELGYPHYRCSARPWAGRLPVRDVARNVRPGCRIARVRSARQRFRFLRPLLDLRAGPGGGCDVVSLRRAARFVASGIPACWPAASM